jgi:hypothetical protein
VSRVTSKEEKQHGSIPQNDIFERLKEHRQQLNAWQEQWEGFEL